MISIDTDTRVFICSEPVDCRKSFDALSGIVREQFGMNPLSGYLFVFFSRRYDRLKFLAWDADGFVIYYKRLERGTYSWIKELVLNEGGEMDAADFSLILSGINPQPSVIRQKRKPCDASPVASLHLV